MVKNSFFVFLCLLINFSLIAQDAGAQYKAKRYDLYLLIGQSNMAGRGQVEAQNTVVHPRVFALDKNNQWVPAKGPIHFDKKAAGAGLGRTFGIEMANNDPDAVIGLIPCAVGGTPIDAWNPGVFYSPTKSYPWDDMVKRLHAALKEGELKGILWHQGESDSNPEKCNDYKIKLESLIKRVRDEVGNEKIPFIAGELGKFFIKKNKKEYKGVKPCPAQVVVKSTKKVAQQDGTVGFVFSNGLTGQGDETHFNTASYRALGVRYANEMIRIQNRF